MKKFRFLLLSVALTLVTMLSSCLNNDMPSSPIITYVTVGSGYLGTTYLIQDITGVKMVDPSASLLAHDLKEGDRALLSYKLQEGFIPTASSKEYQIEIVKLEKINSKEILEKPVAGSAGDTLRNDSIAFFYAAAYSIGFPDAVWAYNGYVTTGILFSAKSYGYVDLVQEDIKKDTLFLRINLNADRGSATGGGNYSFYMPRRDDLENGGIQPQNDSIVVAVSAKVKVVGENSSKIESRYWKYKLD